MLKRRKFAPTRTAKLYFGLMMGFTTAAGGIHYLLWTLFHKGGWTFAWTFGLASTITLTIIFFVLNGLEEVCPEVLVHQSAREILQNERDDGR